MELVNMLHRSIYLCNTFPTLVITNCITSIYLRNISPTVVIINCITICTRSYSCEPKPHYFKFYKLQEKDRFCINTK